MVAFVLQMINMFANVCKVDGLQTVTDCYGSFTVAVIVLLLLNLAIDVVQFLTVKKHYEAKG